MRDTTTLIPAERIVQHLGYIDYLIRWMQPDDHELGACQEPESNFKGCELCAINGILQDVKWAGGRERTYRLLGFTIRGDIASGPIWYPTEEGQVSDVDVLVQVPNE